MVRSRGRRALPVRLAGVRTRWRTVDAGEFFCPECGGDRGYRLRAGYRRFVLLGLPLLSRGQACPAVECAGCREHFGTDSLERVTSHRLAALLRDAVHSVALAVLAAGGSDSRTTREAAVAMVHTAGFPECTEEQLLALLAALRADPRCGADAGGRRFDGAPAAALGPVGNGDGGDGGDGGSAGAGAGAGLESELHEALRPLAPHLAAAGRESLLLQGAAVALADGPYRPSETDTLEAVASALSIPPEDTQRVLAAARTPL